MWGGGADNGDNQIMGVAFFLLIPFMGIFLHLFSLYLNSISLNHSSVSAMMMYVSFLKGSREKTKCAPASGMVSSTILQASPE